MDSGGKILLHHAALPVQAAPGLASRLGRCLLDEVAEVAGLELRAADLQRSSDGRPYWPGGPCFSIAHDANWVACALAPVGLVVGLDLEYAGAVTAASLRLVASAAERQQMQDGRLDATWLWVCKEAVLKAAGSGIREASKVEIVDHVGHHAGRCYALQRLELAPGQVVALASWPTAARVETCQRQAAALLAGGE